MVFATVQTVPITVVYTCCVNGEPVLTRGTRTISSPSFRTQRSCGRRPILSLINVPNNRGATWLQHGNSLGNWSERWRDFGYIERVCSSRAWNKFPFASSLSISFFSPFPPLCSDRSSFRIKNSFKRDFFREFFEFRFFFIRIRGMFVFLSREKTIRLDSR